MQTAILTLHVIVCIFLVILVLLQSGREGMGVIFGGGGDNSVFGTAGAGGILVKLTTFLAVIFVCTSLGYNLMVGSFKKDQKTVLDVKFEEVETPASEAGKAPADIKTEAPKPSETAPAAQTAAPAEPAKAEAPAAGSDASKPADAAADSEKPSDVNPDAQKSATAPADQAAAPAKPAKTEPPAAGSNAFKPADAAAGSEKPADVNAAAQKTEQSSAASQQQEATPDNAAAQPASPNIQ